MLLTLIFLVLGQLNSMVMVQIPSSVIVNQSKAIVRGRVESVTSRKENKLIYTYYTFRVDSDGYIKKGTVGSNTVTIRTIGGKVGDEILDVPGFPVLSKGGDYVLFLEKRGTRYNIYGAPQGCMKVIKDESQTSVVVPCESRYFNSVYIEQAGGELPPLRRVPLEEFEKKIREYQAR